ncbi:hypothetical protein EYF80_019203 [Liparis tanakae]|uniref:Uncharacterized protein n=1 Tax=Liparis tanakae TaxID=230148 RepID=A0A4Z2HXQ8_9TELE|nr:hypothetical protein EYF80_019203 [Liparis tanakae]
MSKTKLERQGGVRSGSTQDQRDKFLFVKECSVDVPDVILQRVETLLQRRDLRILLSHRVDQASLTWQLNVWLIQSQTCPASLFHLAQPLQLIENITSENRASALVGRAVALAI